MPHPVKYRLIALALLAGVAHAEVPTDAPIRPYYDCMVSAVQDYARKTDRADDAIAAADAECEPLMRDLFTQVVASKPDPVFASDYHQHRQVEATMRKARAKLRPAFVRAFLRAR